MRTRRVKRWYGWADEIVLEPTNTKSETHPVEPVETRSARPVRICSVEGCGNRLRHYGWCAKHLDAMKATRPEKVEERRRAVFRIPDDEHGRRSRYTKGCRCDRCREAERLYRADYRNRTRNS